MKNFDEIQVTLKELENTNKMLLPQLLEVMAENK